MVHSRQRHMFYFILFHKCLHYSNYVEINIDRKKHEVVISELNTDIDSISPGEELEVKVRADNLGRSDEDVVFNVEIPALNISQKSEEFKIEKYGDKERVLRWSKISCAGFPRKG